MLKEPCEILYKPACLLSSWKATGAADLHCLLSSAMSVQPVSWGRCVFSCHVNAVPCQCCATGIVAQTAIIAALKEYLGCRAWLWVKLLSASGVEVALSQHPSLSLLPRLVWKGTVRVASMTMMQGLPSRQVLHGAEWAELLFPQFLPAVIQV